MNKNLRNVLKAFMLLVCFSFFQNETNAQTFDNGIFFQALARDNYSNPAKDRKIFVQSTIIQSTINGTKVLVEEYQTSTDATGVFGISIGKGTRTGGSLSALNNIDWSAGPYFLNLKISITPVAPLESWNYAKDWVDLGTTSFGSVPYAYFAKSVAGFDTKVNVSDTAKMLLPYAKAQAVQALSTTVDSKLSAKDTLTMLAPYAKSQAVQALSTTVDSKLSAKDTLTMLAPYAKAAYVLDSAYIKSQLKSKINIADSAISYVTPLSLTTAINSLVDAGTLTGTTLKSTVTGSSLTSVGTLANLTVTNPIVGSITGNAATATIAGNITNTSNSTLTSLPNLSSFGTISSGTISLTTDIKTSGSLTTGAVTYPKVDGSNGQVLTTNGAGVPTWITPTTGGVDLITNQTIGGSKAFSNNIYVQGLEAGLGSGSQSTLLGAATYAGTNGTAIGFMSQNGNSGTNNTSVGSNTLRNSGAASNNTVIGAEAGQAMGNGNTIIGASASANNNSAVSNSTAIGANALVATSNTIQLGNTSVTNVKTSGTLTAGLITYPNSAGTNGYYLTTDGIGTASWAAVSGGGISSIGTFGSSTANGASILSGVLSLTPADATNGGIVTTGTQTFAGAKTFNTDLIVNGMKVGATSYATILGINATASSYATSLGNNASAASSYSVAIGRYASAASSYSLAIGGLNATASQTYSVAIGGNAPSATGVYSTAIGGSVPSASGLQSTAIGSSTSASGTNSTALGYGASVSSNNTIQIGNTSVTTIGGQVAWTAASDIRIKKNIINSNYGLSTVLKLRPVEYNLISNNLRQVGFIAQEVQKLVPEVVTGKEGDLKKGEILGITYSNLVPVLTKAIQEQQKQIEDQNKKIQRLEALVEQLINKKK